MSDVTTAVRDISALTKAAQTACNLFMERCTAAGLKVLITETYRSQTRQNYLYSLGRSRPGNKVTWTKTSRHTSGRAWDICKNVKGEEYSDASFFKKCGVIAAELGITWGGTWSTPDMPHFEIDTDWTYEGDEIDMGELKALEARVSALENKMIYNYVDENMPEWAKDTVTKLMSKGVLKGTDSGLNLNNEMLRMLVILDRAGIFGEYGG